MGMKAVEIQLQKSSIFRKLAEDLMDITQLMVPPNRHLRHINIDVKKLTLIVITEEDEDAEPDRGK